MTTPTCATCETALEPGFLPEATPGGFYLTVWHRGAPSTEKATWKEKLASPNGINYDPAAVLAIEAMRCPTCGRLELFANRAPGKHEAL